MVCTFTDPISALEHFQMNQDAYALVISDYRMSELNGMELFKKMKELNKFVRTILMTAFALGDKNFKEYTRKEIINSFLQKPIRLNNLLKEVETQLQFYENQKIPTQR